VAGGDYFLKVDGIPGESQDAKHKGEIQLESFSWGEAQPRQPPGGGGGGRVQIEDFHFTTPTSIASPKLLLACASGAHVKAAVLTARKAGSERQEYLKYTFTDLLVSTYRTATAEDSVVPVDEVSFNFGRIDVEYRPQAPDGTLGAPVKASWDVKNNRPGT
jgi:type VI secretion system secreted protein Hcp